MDLTKFTGEKKDKISNQNKKEEVLVNNSDLKIIKIDDEVEFFFKTKKGFKLAEDFLFFSTTNSKICKTNNDAKNFFQKSLDMGTEGVMFKNLKEIYKPGLRTGGMAKLKDTKEPIDVVILGAEYGQGKRSGFYSSFIMGVKNDDFIDDEDRFLIIGKVSSGVLELGEEGHTLENLTNLLKPLKIREESSVVYFEPRIVLQVKYQEIQRSNAYNSGFALRFPRIMMLRSDKTVEEINSIEDIESFI